MIYKAHYKKLIIEQLLPEHHKISGWTQMLRKSVQFLLVPPSFFILLTIQDEKYCTLRTTFNLFLLQFYYRLCIFRVILVKDKGKYAYLHCYCVMTLWPLLCFILFINLASKTVMIIMKLIEIVVIYCICLQRYKMYIF
jgi:hypothetical protein